MDIAGVVHHYGKKDLGHGKSARYADAAHSLIWSVQPDGSLQTRPADAIQGWETGKDDGQTWTVKTDGGKLYSFVSVDVSGL